MSNDKNVEVVFIPAGKKEAPHGIRAQKFAKRIKRSYIILNREHRIFSFFYFLSKIITLNPKVIWVVAFSPEGILTGLIGRGMGKKFIYEAGDVDCTLARSQRKLIGSAIICLFEYAALHFSHLTVVRGTYHRKYLKKKKIKKICVIRDSIEIKNIPSERVTLKKMYNLTDKLTIGICGNFIWNPRLKNTYGWEILKALSILKDKRVYGVFIGNGNGIPHLKAMAREMGVEDRVVFTGRVPPDKVLEYLSIIDIATSTQFGEVGWVRTTAKLPTYLGTERYILASDVGEAHLLLPEEFRLPYKGIIDENYPYLIAKRIKKILNHPEILNHRKGLKKIAEKYLNYDINGKIVEAILNLFI